MDVDPIQVFRVVALTLSATMFAITVAVLHAYMVVWRQQRKRSQTGLLPFHVWTIATSHLLAQGYMNVEVLHLAGQGADLTIRGPVMLLSAAFGLASLLSVLRFEMKRKRTLRDQLAKESTS